MPARFVEVNDFASEHFGEWPSSASWNASWTVGWPAPSVPRAPQGAPLYAMAASAAVYALYFLLLQVLSRKYVRAHGHAHLD